MLNWNERVALVDAARDTSLRQIHLAGLGQALDPLMWPIIARFWALGIPTVGSCQGHYSPSNCSEAVTFVSVRSSQADAEARRWRLVKAFLTPPVAPYVLFSASVMGFEVYYRPVDSKETFEQRQQEALSVWVDKLDRVGRECTQQEPPWVSWEGPARDVPESVDAFRLKVPFIRYLGELDHLSERIVRWQLSGFSWEDTARYQGVSVNEAQARWNQAWAGWLERQKSVTV